MNTNEAKLIVIDANRPNYFTLDGERFEGVKEIDKIWRSSGVSVNLKIKIWKTLERVSSDMWLEQERSPFRQGNLMCVRARVFKYIQAEILK